MGYYAAPWSLSSGQPVPDSFDLTGYEDRGFFFGGRVPYAEHASRITEDPTTGARRIILTAGTVYAGDGSYYLPIYDADYNVIGYEYVESGAYNLGLSGFASRSLRGHAGEGPPPVDLTSMHMAFIGGGEMTFGVGESVGDGWEAYCGVHSSPAQLNSAGFSFDGFGGMTPQANQDSGNGFGNSVLPPDILAGVLNGERIPMPPYVKVRWDAASVPSFYSSVDGVTFDLMFTCTAPVPVDRGVLHAALTVAPRLESDPPRSFPNGPHSVSLTEFSYTPSPPGQYLVAAHNGWRQGNYHVAANAPFGGTGWNLATYIIK